MEIVKESILELLSVSVIVSSIVMIIIQKFKHFAFVNKNYQIGLLNFAFSFFANTTNPDVSLSNLFTINTF